MIEDLLTVYYGYEHQQFDELDKTQIALQRVPEKGDCIIIDDEPYKVFNHVYDSDEGTVAVIACFESDFLPYTEL